MKQLRKCLGMLVAAGLLAVPFAGQAVVKLPPEPVTKKQSFKANSKSTFIDFSTFGELLKDPEDRKSSKNFGRVKFKPTIKRNKKVPVVIDFGAPLPGGATGKGHTVSVEMVSLSLVSVNPVSVNGAQDPGAAFLNLALSVPASTGADAFLDPTKKGKGTFTIKNKKLSKSLKLSKKMLNTSPKNFSELKLETFAKDVPFSFASPISVTAPFCLQSGGPGQASICLAPLAAASAPNTSVLLALGLGAAVSLAVVRRRRVALRQQAAH